jgi:uroporphyrinogen-III synthase
VSQLIWTRALADWEDDRVHLEGRLPPGVVLSRIPCITVQGVAPPPLVGPPPEHVVFTSPTAVARTFAHASAGEAVRRAAHVWTFGKQTQRALAERRVAAHLVDEASTAEELAAFLAKTLVRGSRVLLPAPEAPAFDLAGALSDAGLSVMPFVCYRTVLGASRPDGTTVPAPEAETLARTMSGAAAFASPSALTGFLSAFGASPASAAHLRSSLTAVTMGKTTAKAASSHFAVVVTAAEASVAALARAAIDALTSPRRA